MLPLFVLNYWGTHSNNQCWVLSFDVTEASFMLIPSKLHIHCKYQQQEVNSKGVLT